jgi:hypothetical protein
MTAREHMKRFFDTSITAGWPALILVAVFIPLRFAAHAWLDADELETLHAFAMSAGWFAAKVGAAFYGGLVVLGSTIIAMALLNGTRTLREAAGPIFATIILFAVTVGLVLS